MTETAIEFGPDAANPLLLRDREAARLLGISREKMSLLMRRGEVPGVIRLGRSVRIHRPTLERWLAEQAVAVREGGDAA